MNTRRLLPLLTLALCLLAPASAAATTFCVPTFHAACPNSGGNVAEASLEAAMQTKGDDGIADQIVIAPVTVTDVDSYTLDSGDNDDLEIVGAGPALTVITNTASTNSFVMNLNGARDVTVRDLTIRVPASMPDHGGGALQSEQDTFENVDIESRNVRSDGAQSMIGGGTFRDGRVYGSMGGSIDVGFSGNGAQSGTLLIERTSIEDASWGISSDDPEVTVFARRVGIHDPLAYGLRVSDGAFAVFENGVIESTTAIPVVAESNDAGTVIATVRHATIVGVDLEPGEFAIQSKVQNAVGNGPVNLVVSDTIVAGYTDPLRCEAPTAANVGNASLTVRYSWFFHSAVANGDCNLTNPNTIDAFDPSVGAPQFAGPGDYRLPLGSPAIDSGDPLTASLPVEDFAGALRPVDGDGDANARRDMGAFEYQPPAPPGTGGGPTTPGPTGPMPPAGGETPDPAPSIAKLRLLRLPTAARPGRLRLNLSEPARVVVTLKRIVRRKGRKPRAIRQAFAGKAGVNVLKLRKRNLAPGRYRLSVVAIDGAANRSAPVYRTRKVT